MIIFIRHGTTASNGKDHEKLRGWLPIPLTLEGMHEAKQVAIDLSQTIDKTDLAAIHCGTLVRVVQTAAEIAEYFDMILSPDEAFNDWDTGDLAGTMVEESLPEILDHIKHPYRVLPNGESYHQWLTRILPKLKPLVEAPELNILVSSGRVGTLLSALSKTKGDEPDQAIMLGKPPIDPSGLMFLKSDWEIVYSTPVDPEEKGT